MVVAGEGERESAARKESGGRKHSQGLNEFLTIFANKRNK